METLSPTRPFFVSSRNTPPQRNSGKGRGVTNQRTVAWETGGNKALRFEKFKVIDEKKLEY